MTLHLHHVPAEAPQHATVVTRYATVTVERDGDEIIVRVIDAHGTDLDETLYLTNADAQALIDALHSVRGGTHA